jgi:hydrogenase/urease accessory protein HupE
MPPRGLFWMLVCFALTYSCMLNSSPLSAHESRPAFLQLKQTAPDAFDVLWKVPAMGENLRLGLYVRLPETVELISEPRAVFQDAAYTERWSIKEPRALVGSTIHIDGLRNTLTDVLVRIERLDGTTQVARLAPESPSLLVEAAPSGWQVARTYFGLGMEHILLGFDHLLFVLGLLLIVDRRWMLIKTITAFTVAHSLTLALSVLSVVQVPDAPLNMAIALSILFLGPEIVRKWRDQSSLTIRHPWVVAFLFGLLHGIGFASGLSVTGLPQSEIPSALLFFNVGVEAGQLVFVLVALSVAASIRTLELDRPQWVTRVPAYVVGTLGAFWTIRCVYALADTLVTRT